MKEPYKRLSLGLSPITGRIYLGRINPKHSGFWVGEKRDVTSQFIEVMLQKFEPGYETTIEENGKPKYSVTVRKIKKPKAKIKKEQGE